MLRYRSLLLVLGQSVALRRLSLQKRGQGETGATINGVLIANCVICRWFIFFTAEKFVTKSIPSL
jgi:hypothetical protein